MAMQEMIRVTIWDTLANLLQHKILCLKHYDEWLDSEVTTNSDWRVTTVKTFHECDHKLNGFSECKNYWTASN